MPTPGVLGAFFRGAVLMGTVGAFSGVAVAGGRTAEAKVDICHLPPGNPGNVQPITVGASAVAAHQQHGDAMPTTWWRDVDGDGCGEAAGAYVGCTGQPGYVLDGPDSAACEKQPTCEIWTDERGQQHGQAFDADCPGDEAPVCASDGVQWFNDCAAKVCGVEQATPGACLVGKTVFVTSTTWPGTFGGGSDPIAVADGICQDLADGAGLAGTFKAWLSDRSRSPNTGFARSTDPYVLVDGTVVAGDYDELIDWTRGVRVPIDVTESGDSVASGSVWTGTFATGDRGNLGTMCNGAYGAPVDWSVATSWGPGAVGYLHSSGWEWTEVGTSESCAASNRFYCFEQ